MAQNFEQNTSVIDSIHAALQKLTGLHRQLMETVRMEREALVAADIRRIEEATVAKQALVEAIRQAESRRIGHVAELAVILRKPVRELTLPAIIIQVQGHDAKRAEQLRSAFNALTLLIKRIAEQNTSNQRLVEESLMHVQQMKGNVLGETTPKANTYTAKGQRSGAQPGARLFSKEA